MADYDVLTYHRLVARYNGIVADTTGPLGDPGTSPDLYAINTVANIAINVAKAGKLRSVPPELRLTAAEPPRTLLLTPIKAQLESGVLRLPGAGSGVDGVDLVAKSAIMGLAPDEDLVATVRFNATTIGGVSFQPDTVAYVIPTIEDEAYEAGFVQVVTLIGNPEGGNWAVVYGGHPTAWVPWNATTEAFQAVLRDIIGPAVSVDAGPAGGPYWVRFDTALIPRPQPLGGIDNLTGGSLPDVKVTDSWAIPTIDLTTVPRFVAA